MVTVTVSNTDPEVFTSDEVEVTLRGPIDEVRAALERAGLQVES